MNLSTILPLMSAVVVSYLGLLVFMHGRKEKLNISFASFTLVIAIWMFATFMMFLNLDDTSKVLFWDKIVYTGVVFVPVIMLNYGLALTNYKIINGKILSRLGYILSVFFLLSIPTKLFVDGSFVYQWGAHSKAQILHSIFLVYFCVYLLIWFIIVYKYYKQSSDSIEREKIKYSFTAFIILASVGSLGYLPAYGISIYPFAYISGLIFSIIIAYAIIVHRLMDIRLVARKYLVTSAYIATVGAVFLVTKYFFSIFIPKSLGDLVDLAFLVVAILFTSPIKSFYYRVANKYFFSSLYDSSKLIAEISEGLRSTIEIDKIFSFIDQSLKKTLHLKAFAVLIFSEKEGVYTIGYNHGFDTGKKNIFPLDKYLHKYYTKTNQLIITNELLQENNQLYSKTLELLSKLHVEMLIPLNVKNETIGLLALGEKETGDLYNHEDIKVLKVISSQAAVAIDNAKLYDEVSDFNETLQGKVDAQTKEIQAKAEHLKKLMDMRSEFLDITSHQLRTPVSVIKGVLSMLEEGSIPQARVSEFIRGAMEKAIKLGEIINDILRASEMDTDKFTMTVRPVDLIELLTKIKEDKRRTAEMRKLAMVYNIPPNLPLVLTDPKYVEHAIVNLINNSLQYTIDGSITTSVEVNKTHVIIRVADTGIGIPKNALPKLFTKFARAENAVTTFTDGTGLGLFIIKQIVDANPGAKIEVERTEVGKGTTFALWLPIATDPKAKPVKTSAK